MSEETATSGTKIREVPDHPDARAAARMLLDAEKQNSWGAAKVAFAKLEDVCVQLEKVLGTLAALYGGDHGKQPSDSQSLERVALAAIALAEKVIDGKTSA